MTINQPWTPELSHRTGPRYRAIAEALEEEIAEGRLREGSRLPTHRDLADALGVTVGTVTRAYALARRRGFVAGEVGRGTFVRGAPPARAETFAIEDRSEPDTIELSLSIAPREQRVDLVADRLGELARDPSLADLCSYQPEAGHPRHRAAGARWLSSLGVEAHEDEVVVTAGVQHGLSLALSTCTRPGDAVLTEALTYPGVQWVADQHGLRLEGVALDEQGMRPDALRERIRQTGARTLYCTPHWQNPTGATMSEDRRAELAGIARESDLLIVEDDVYRPMLDEPRRPLSDFAPERSVFLTGFSKGVAAGLRVGFLRTTPERAARLGTGLRTGMWMVAPVMAELAARLVDSGAAASMIEWKRREMTLRYEAARRLLPEALGQRPAPAHHVWIPLPQPRTARAFVAEALERGVRVAGTGSFAVGGAGPPQEGIRLSLLSPASTAAAARGLRIVAELLGRPADTGLSIL
ncbi:MAG: PLP-dependent aminotransferase family protein [Myxococcota bacterium]